MKQIIFLLLTASCMVIGAPLYTFSTTTSLDGVDDACSSLVTLNHVYKFFGSDFNGFRVNPNGQIYLTDCSPGGDPNPVTLPTATDQIIAPFWANVDLTVDIPSSLPASAVYYSFESTGSPIDSLFPLFSAQEYFMVTWNKVPYFNGQTDRYNSFQAVVATDGISTYACFQYPNAADSGNVNGGLDWSEGTGSAGGILSSNPAIVAFNAGDNSRYYLHPDSASDRIRSIDGVQNGAAAASQAGINEGQYCYEISGNNIISFAPGIITSPLPNSFANAAQVTSFPITVKDINTGTTATITATSGAFTRTVSATGDINHEISTILNLSGFPEGIFTITVRKVTTVRTFTTILSTVSVDTLLSVDISSPAPNTWVNILSYVTFEVSGSGEDAASVFLTITDGTTSITTYSTIVSSSTWTIVQSLETLQDGNIQITAHSVDPAGNTAQSQTSLTVRLDRSISISITDPILDYLVTPSNVNSVLFSGTTDIGNRVMVTVQSNTNNIQRSANVDANGDWSITMSVITMPEGESAVYATATDDAGNTDSATSSIYKDTSTYVSFDTVDPITSFDVASFTIYGFAEAGDSIVLQIGSNILGNTVASSDESWFFEDLNLSSYPDGPIQFYVYASDVYGNTDSESVVTTKDISTTISITSPIDLTLLSLSQITNLQITGTGEASGLVTVKISDDFKDDYYSTVVSSSLSSPTWSISSIDVSTFVDGYVEVTATITDSVGNFDDVSIELQKDTGTTVSVTFPFTPSQFINSNQQSNFIVSGTGEYRALVYLVISDNSQLTSDITTSTTTVSSTSTWSISTSISSLLDGPITFTAHAVDITGNTAVSNPPGVATKDTVSTVSLITPASGDIINSITVSNVLFNGFAEPFGLVHVVASDFYGNSLSSPTVTANYIGSWFSSANLNSLVDGPVTLTAFVTDLPGNTARSSISVVKDTSTLILITSPSPDSFLNQYNFHSFPISGTGEPFSSVFVTIDDSVAGTANVVTPSTTVSSAGIWQINGVDVSSLHEGSLRFTATLTDSSGNIKNSPVVIIIKDTFIQLVIAVPSNFQYIISEERAPSVSVSGFGDTDNVSLFVTFSDSSRNKHSDVVLITPVGTWSVVTDVSSLRDSTISITATGVDGAGNIGYSQTVRLSKDTTLAAATINSPVDGSSISQSQSSNLFISGISEGSSRISLRITGTSGVISQLIVAAPDGTWSTVANISALPAGLITIGGTVADIADNTSTITPITITKL